MITLVTRGGLEGWLDRRGCRTAGSLVTGTLSGSGSVPCEADSRVLVVAFPQPVARIMAAPLPGEW